MKKTIGGKRIKDRKHIVVVGATSAIAEHCMRLWITQSPADLVLIARNEKKVKMIASDLKARSPDSVIEVLQTDFLNATAIKNLVNKIAQRKSVDIALIAHGTLPDQKNCEQDLELNQSVLELNAISPVLFAEAFALHMQKSKGGTLALIGSVAGDRGRKSNYVYGAAKGLITRYTQGLQHRFAKTNVKVVLIKPGPTATPMTAHLEGKGQKLADVERVASHIVKGIEKSSPEVYAPKKWVLIMLIIRHLPRFIFNKIDI